MTIDYCKFSVKFVKSTFQYQLLTVNAVNPRISAPAQWLVAELAAIPPRGRRRGGNASLLYETVGAGEMGCTRDPFQVLKHWFWMIWC